MIGKPQYGPKPTEVQSTIIVKWIGHWTFIPSNRYGIRPGYYGKGDLARLLRSTSDRHSDPLKTAAKVRFIADMME